MRESPGAGRSRLRSLIRAVGIGLLLLGAYNAVFLQLFFTPVWAPYAPVFEPFVSGPGASAVREHLVVVVVGAILAWIA